MGVSFRGLGWIAPVIPIVIAAIIIFTVGMSNIYFLCGIAFLIAAPITFVVGFLLNRKDDSDDEGAMHQVANMPMQYAGIFWAVAGVALIIFSLL